MADSLSSGRGRKLPPLSSKSVPSEQGSIAGDTPRKKKKKKPVSNEETVEDTPGRESVRRPKKTTRSDELQEGEVSSKKRRKPVGSSREALMSDNEVLSDRSEHKKKKRKKKPAQETRVDETDTVGDLGLAGELGDLREDVVEVKEDTEQVQWSNTPAMRSEPIPKIFIEKEGGFKTTDKSKLARKRAEQQRRVEAIPVAPPDYNTMQVAFGAHRVFKTLTLFLQGLFAGIALWHIVAVWTLSTNGWSVFLEYYNKLALPVACMYYFLFALVTVAVFDRYDIGRPTRRLFGRCCTMQSGMIACLIYFTGLLFSLGITNIDEKIGLYSHNETLWPEGDATNSELNTWRILNLMRGLMAILGWFVIALRPNTDRLKKNLQQEDDLFFEEVGAEISAVMGGESNGV